MVNKDVVLVGLHIPKCAGTTLLDRVASCLPAHSIYQTTSFIKNYREGAPEFPQMQSHDQLRFIFGHWVHEEMVKSIGKRCILFTGLREPIQRFISLINYQSRLSLLQGREKVTTLKALDELEPGDYNQMCWTLIGRFPSLAGEKGSPADRAFRVLQNFHLVYFAENFEQTADAIFRILGIAPKAVNVNEAVEKVTDFPIDKNLLKYDIELYARAREAFYEIKPSESLRRARPAIAQLMVTPPDPARLRDFLYRRMFKEYQDWVGIDTIIESRIKLIEELSAEVSSYMRMKQEVAATGHETRARKAR